MINGRRPRSEIQEMQRSSKANHVAPGALLYK